MSAIVISKSSAIIPAKSVEIRLNKLGRITVRIFESRTSVKYYTFYDFPSHENNAQRDQHRIHEMCEGNNWTADLGFYDFTALDHNDEVYVKIYRRLDGPKEYENEVDADYAELKILTKHLKEKYREAFLKKKMPPRQHEGGKTTP